MRRRIVAFATALACALSLVPKAFAKAPEQRDERREHRDERREHRDEHRDERQKERAEARKERAEQRRERRRRHLAALSARFGSMLQKPALRAELELHARRAAKLKALRAVAEREGKVALLPRIDKLAQKEQARHEQRLAALTATADAGRAP